MGKIIEAVVAIAVIGSLLFMGSYMDKKNQSLKTSEDITIEYSEVWKVDKLTLAENKKFIVDNTNKELFIFQNNIQEVFNADSEIKSVEILSNTRKDPLNGDYGISGNPKIIISDNIENVFYDTGKLSANVIKIKIIK